MNVGRFKQGSASAPGMNLGSERTTVNLPLAADEPVETSN